MAVEKLITKIIVTGDNKANTQVNKLDKNFASMAKNIVGIAAVALVAAKGIKFMADSAKLLREDNVEFAKLEAIIKATGGAAGTSAQEMSDLAQSIQDATGISNTLIMTTEGMLATFKEIGEEAFPRATQAVVDMSAVQGELTSNTLALGKALNDPIAGVGALSRVGVKFTDQQKEQIKVLQKSGDMLGAQTIILEELEGQFKGAAEAAATNTKKMAASFDDLRKTLATNLEPIIQDMAGIATEGIQAFSDGFLEGLNELSFDPETLETFEEDIKRISESLGKLTAGIVNDTSKVLEGFASGTLPGVSDSIYEVTKTVLPLVIAFKGLKFIAGAWGPLAIAVSAKTMTLSTAFTTLGASMLTAFAPFLAVAIPISAMVVILKSLEKHILDTTEASEKFWEDVDKNWTAGLDVIKYTTDAFEKMMTSMSLIQLITKYNEDHGTSIKSLKQAQIELGLVNQGILGGTDEQVAAWFRQKDILSQMIKLFSDSGKSVVDLVSDYDLWVVGLEEGQAKYQKEQDWILILQKANPKLATALGILTDAQKKLRDEQKDSVGGQEKWLEGLIASQSALENEEKWIAELLEANEEYANSLGLLTEAQKKAIVDEKALTKARIDAVGKLKGIYAGIADVGFEAERQSLLATYNLAKESYDDLIELREWYVTALADIDEREAENKRERAIEATNILINSFGGVVGAYESMWQQNMNNEMEALKHSAKYASANADQRVIMEQKVTDKYKEEKKKQWAIDKAINISKSIIDTISAVTEALPNLALAIAVGALGAIQTAMIVATPPPVFGLGGDFETRGPQLIMVGDNPGGREHVSITPTSSPNVNGPQDGIRLITKTNFVTVNGELLMSQVDDEIIYDKNQKGEIIVGAQI